MKKFTLIGSLILSLNASNLTDNLLDGTIGATVSLWYQSTDDKTPYWQSEPTNKDIFNKANSIANAGLEVNYLSKETNGFSIGAKFYLLDSLNLHYDIVSSTPNGNLGVNKSATWLGEGYIKYRHNDTVFKLGRQNLHSPLMNSDTWAVHPNNFEGFSFFDKTLGDVKIFGAVVTKERVFDKEEFEDFMSFTQIDSDYSGVLGVIYNYDDILARAFYYSVENITDAIYTDIGYRYGYFNASAQLISMLPSDEMQDRYNSDENTLAYGVKLGFIYDIFDFSIAYAQTSEDGFMPISNLADNMQKSPLYTATITGDSDIVGVTDTTSYKASLRTNITENLSTILNWGFYKHGKKANYLGDSSGADDESLTAEAIIKYQYDKNLELFCAYMFSDEAKGKFFNDSENVNSIRVWAKYRF